MPKVNSFRALMILLLVLAQVILLNTMSFNSSPLDFKVISYGWNSQLNPLRVYPGSSKVTYYVTLMYLGSSQVSKIYAELKLPRGLVTYSEGSSIVYRELSVALSRYDSVTLDFPNINVSSDLVGGEYTGELRITYVVSGNVEYSTTIYVPMHVNSLPSQPLELVDYYWSSRDGLRRSVELGFREVDLIFYFRVRDEVSVTNMYSYIELPKGITCGGLSNATSAVDVTYGRGDLIKLTFRNIDIDGNLGYGAYNATLTINAQLDLYGLSTNVTQVFNVSLVVSPTELESLDIVNAFWGRDQPLPVYVNTSNAAISITFMNVGYDDVYGISGILLLPEGFKSTYGEGFINFTVANRLSSGSLITCIIPGINVGNVEPGRYVFKLLVNYFRDFQGTSVKIIQEFNITLNVLGPKDSVSVLNARWVNNYGLAFPGSRAEEYEVTMANWDRFQVDLLEAHVEVPSGFEVTSLSGDCFNGISPYSTCSLRLIINVYDYVQPGIYSANISVKYVLRLDDSYSVSLRELPLDIRVWDPSIFGAKLEPALVVWGDEANPRIALPGSRVLPLTIRLINTGKDVASGVVASLDLPEGMKMTYPGSKGFCDRIDRGSSCLVRFYIDLDPKLTPGTYLTNLTVNYITYFNSLNISKVERRIIALAVENVPRELKLYLVEANWSNRWPAYPGDKAVLNIRLANLAPYPISSVIARLELPDGITCSGRSSCDTYYSGPVNQYQQFNITYALELGSTLSPGVYEGRLLVDYIVNSGGYGIRMLEYLNLSIYVSNITNSIKFVGAYWVNTTPSKGDVGLLRVILRNDELPSIDGLVLDVYLPAGMVALPNNSSKVSIPYLSQATDLSRYLSVPLPPQAVTPSRISQGDIAYVDVPVRLLENVSEGLREFIVTLDFLDHWGSPQRFNLTAEAYVGSKYRVLSIMPIDNVVVAGKALSTVRYEIRNLGDAPLYNLIVFTTIPYTALGVISPIKYVDVLPAMSSKILEFNVTANPDVIEGPYPIVFVVVAQDFGGRFYNMNLTSTVIVEGYMGIKLLTPQLSPKVVGNGSILSFSATLINEGKAPLRHAEAILESEVLETCEPYYIGNVDPGAQVPISLEAVVKSDVKPGNYVVKVVIRYYNVFYALRTYESRYIVTVTANVTTATPSTPTLLPAIPAYGVALIACIVVFVIAVMVLYLRWFRKRVRKVD